MFRLVSLLILLFSSSVFAAGETVYWGLWGPFGPTGSAASACSGSGAIRNSTNPDNTCSFSSASGGACYGDCSSSGSNVHYVDYAAIVNTCPADQFPSSNGSCMSCSGDDVYDPSSSSCTSGPPPCTLGSLAPDCAVTCPDVQYTYTKDGVLRRGNIGAGQVGYGQSCPTPSFPPGSDAGCVGTPGTCTDYNDGINEGEDVTDTTTTTTSDGDTETTTKTTDTKDGGSSTTGINPGGGDTKVDTSGNPIDPENPPEGMVDDTVDIGDNTFGMCDHGGAVDGVIGCDYNPPSCTGNQLPTSFGCVDIPTPTQTETPPVDIVVTTTDPTTGDTVTDTRTTSGTDEGDGTGVYDVPEEPTPEETFVGGGDCSAPPACSGSPVNCGIANQMWQLKCSGEDGTASVLTAISTEISTDSKFNNPWDTATSTDLTTVPIFGNGGYLTASCPADISINTLSAGTIVINFQWLCDLAAYLKPIVLLIATMVALRIVGGAF